MKGSLPLAVAVVGLVTLAPSLLLADLPAPAAGQWTSFRIPAAGRGPAPTGATVRSQAPVYAFKLVIPPHQVVVGKKWVLETEIQAMPEGYEVELTLFDPASWADHQAFPTVPGGGFTRRRAGGFPTWARSVEGPEVHVIIGNRQGRPPSSEIRGRLRWTIQDERRR